MSLLTWFRVRIATLLQSSQLSTEMEEELRSHIQHRADDLERSGLTRPEAERRARTEFGGKERFKEECHEALGGGWLETLARDVRFSLRMLRKSPGFTVVAVLTLALGIGANAVVFSALNALILRPLNVPRADSLYSIHRVNDLSAGESYPDYVDSRDRNRSFEDLAAYSILQAGFDAGENPTQAWLASVSGNYFDALGIQPYLGRFFHRSDERGPNSAPYIVLSHGFWHGRFHDDPAVVGRVVEVNKHPFTIVGVAPQGFRGTLLFFSPDFFLPMINQEQIDGSSILTARGDRSIFMTMGHLREGVTPQQAADEMNSISANLEKTYPKDHHHLPLTLARPSLYGEYVGRPLRAFLTALLLLAGLILLAACANLGGLFAARAADRSREVALRLALGATRARVLRQLFTEAMLISLAGGVFGLWGGTILLRWLSSWQPFPQFPMNVAVNPDARVYAVALLLALISGILFGAIPVKQVLGTSPYEVVKSSPSNMSRRKLTGRDVLVVLQIAICAVLITASIVAVRGLLRSLHGNFGFEPRNTMLVDTALNMAGYGPDKAPAMQKRMIDAIQTIPGVTSVGLADWEPLSNGDTRGAVVFTDQTADLRAANAAATAVLFKVSPDYFSAAGTMLLSGRAFTWSDDKDAPRVAVVTQEFARRIFGSASNAIGRYYKLPDGARIQVVGVAEDGKYATLTEDLYPAMYLPILQSPSSDTSLIVRSARDPQQLAAAIKDKVQDLDAGLPCFIHTWNQAMDLPLFPSRVATVSLGVLGGMGAMLSVTGIFGMAAYSVSKRLKELGIRIALGAQRKEVLQAALGRAVRLLAVGSFAGLLLGILATRVLAFIVYQATPRDLWVLAGAVVAMSLLGLLATWIPAHRALSIDTLALLRED